MWLTRDTLIGARLDARRDEENRKTGDEERFHHGCLEAVLMLSSITPELSREQGDLR
jgi:hypothetical protein